MALLDQLFGPHLNHLQRALDRSAERHSLLTANLANLNTPGYKRKDLDFGITLDEEVGKKSHFAEWQRQRQERQADDSSIRVDGNNVDLEKEVFSIAETELRFQALTDMTAGYFSGLKNVIREGR